MKDKEEFYIGYSGSMGRAAKKKVRRFVLVSMTLLFLGSFTFAYFQKQAVNSRYDFGNPSEVVGVYHESPYPMLRVALAPGEFKEVVLLGGGKFGANPFLDDIRKANGHLVGTELTIEGQLIYYNGKTLLEIDDSQRISVSGKGRPTKTIIGGEKKLEGEIVDPKCYFGVMKPGYGKIHRSCAALCISGGIPPVLVVKDAEDREMYFLVTDLKGKPINKDIIPYIGQPVRIFGSLSRVGDWSVVRVDATQIERLDKKSSIY